MGDALEGQRKLVREVHHRVKNNLQVIAIAAQHPRPQRRHARGQGRLCRDRPAGRRAGGGPPQPFRRDGGKSRDRAAAAADRTCRRASARAPPTSARAMADRSRSSKRLSTTQDVAVAVAFLDHRNRRIRHAATVPTTGSRSSLRRDERADRAAEPGMPGAGSRRRATIPRKSSSNGSSRGSPASSARRSTASSAATWSTCRFSPKIDGIRGIGSATKRKYFRVGRNRDGKRAFTASDSDLLPPRSRYPTYMGPEPPTPPPPRWRFRAQIVSGALHSSRSFSR